MYFAYNDGDDEQKIDSVATGEAEYLYLLSPLSLPLVSPW